MKPDLALHRNAQASPNSSGSPKRPAGLSLARSASTCSTGRPRLSDSPFAVPRRRSVLKGPGNRPLMVGLLVTVLGGRSATEPVRAVRAPLEGGNILFGVFAGGEVML